MQQRLVTAFFPWQSGVALALARLLDAGVAREAVSVLPKHPRRLDDLGLRAVSRAPDGAALGALAGGAVAAALGALVAGGALIWPGVGEVVVGPLVAALAAGGAGGAVGMGVGALLGARLPRYEAAYLKDAARGGGGILAVRCPVSDAKQVAALLAGSGGGRIRCVRVGQRDALRDGAR